jgi:beta-lactamase class A
MIKPFVALAFFHQVKMGKLHYGPKSRQQMQAMIQRSSNTATNWVMRQVGGPAKCAEILKQNYGQIFKKTKLVEYIPAGGRTYLNSAPPSDYVRFLKALWSEELPKSDEIRRLMALPGRDRLYHGTPIPRGTLVYNKTGSTGHLCGDMGILVPKNKKGGRFPYVIVGIIEKRSKASNYGQWVHSRSRVIREVSTMIYEELKKEHELL